MDEDRSASFVELFFDLVFVFGVTQVVALVHGHLDWPTLGKAAVVLNLMWWLWTQFTWMAGNADVAKLQPGVVLLAATAGTFIMGVSVQGAFADDGSTFGMAYFGVMVMAAVFFYFRLASTNEMEGYWAYIPRVMVGNVLVLIGGFASEGIRPWVWLAAVVVSVASAAAAGRVEYTIGAGHFAERHGLFVIIVLGEVLIATGLGVVGAERTGPFYVAGTAMLLTALALWWSYFDWLFRIGERALKAATGIVQGRLARDVYSIAHYPLVAGVVLFAIGTEELLAHPGDALDAASRWAFIGGLVIYLASQSVMVWRMHRHITVERWTAIGLLVVAGLALGDVSGAVLGALACGALLTTLRTETARHRDQLRELR